MRRIVPFLCLILAACSGSAPTPDAPKPPQASTPAVPADAPVILAFGDSLYAGYRLAPGEGPDHQRRRIEGW